jgi:hypothetical protein
LLTLGLLGPGIVSTGYDLEYPVPMPDVEWVAVLSHELNNVTRSTALNFMTIVDLQSYDCRKNYVSMKCWELQFRCWGDVHWQIHTSGHHRGRQWPSNDPMILRRFESRTNARHLAEKSAR